MNTQTWNKNVVQSKSLQYFILKKNFQDKNQKINISSTFIECIIYANLVFYAQIIIGLPRKIVLKKLRTLLSNPGFFLKIKIWKSSILIECIVFTLKFGVYAKNRFWNNLGIILKILKKWQFSKIFKIKFRRLIRLIFLFGASCLTYFGFYKTNSFLDFPRFLFRASFLTNLVFIRQIVFF